MSETDEFNAIIEANYDTDHMTADDTRSALAAVATVYAIVAIVGLIILGLAALLLVLPLIWAIAQATTGHADPAAMFILVTVPCLAITLTLMALHARLGWKK